MLFGMPCVDQLLVTEASLPGPKALRCVTSALSSAIVTVGRDLGLSLFGRRATHRSKLTPQADGLRNISTARRHPHVWSLGATPDLSALPAVHRRFYTFG
jgi:hypothetical protein